MSRQAEVISSQTAIGMFCPGREVRALEVILRLAEVLERSKKALRTRAMAEHSGILLLPEGTELPRSPQQLQSLARSSEPVERLHQVESAWDDLVRALRRLHENNKAPTEKRRDQGRRFNHVGLAIVLDPLLAFANFMQVMMAGRPTNPIASSMAKVMFAHAKEDPDFIEAMKLMEEFAGLIRNPIELLLFHIERLRAAPMEG